jgi:hypothetical protein
MHKWQPPLFDEVGEHLHVLPEGIFVNGIRLFVLDSADLV